MLALDGLYMSSSGAYAAYLRLYADGRVVAVTTYRATPIDVAPWLVYDSGNPMFSQGAYTIARQRIAFTTTSSYGSVEYKGWIQSEGEVLALASHSLLNGHRGRATYTLVPTPHNT